MIKREYLYTAETPKKWVSSSLWTRSWFPLGTDYIARTVREAASEHLGCPPNDV